MDTINRENALERLRAIREVYLEERRNAVAGAVRECIETLEGMPKAEPEIKIVTPEARRTVSVEPFFDGGQIGRDVYRCGHCQTQVDKKDRFCKFCGRKMVNHEQN